MPLKVIMFVVWVMGTVQVACTQSNPLVGFAASESTAYSSYHADIFSTFSNSAAMTGINRFTAGAGGEKRFLVQELNSFRAAVMVPARESRFGMTGDFFGSHAFSRSAVALSYARTAGRRASVGTRFGYASTRIEGYGNGSAVLYQVSAQVQVSPVTRTGIAVQNPVPASFTKGITVPVSYAFGLGYDPSKIFFAGAVIEKVERQPLQIRVAMQYHLEKTFSFRWGFTSGTRSCFMSVALVLQHVRLDCTAAYHPVLGITPAITIQYSGAE